MPTLVQELDILHDGYVSAINIAVAENDHVRAESLATDYENEAITLMAEREGLTHLLPLARQQTPDSRLRRLVARLHLHRAA